MNIEVNRLYKEICNLSDKHVPRNHKFYVFNTDTLEMHTFPYRNEMNTFLKLEDLQQAEYGKISYFNYVGEIKIIYLKIGISKENTIYFYEFEDVVSFMKEQNVEVISIHFCNNEAAYLEWKERIENKE